MRRYDVRFGTVIETDVFVSGRAGGKTTAIVDWFLRDWETEDKVIVCADEMSAEFVRKRVWDALRGQDRGVGAVTQTFLKRNIISAQVADDFLRGRQVRVGVDDITRLLPWWAQDIDFVTINGRSYDG